MKETNLSVKSATERERTKMRERQRRSVTTNIFHGLRKHGGYRLSSRADINEVLRHLAHEAGWIIDADGTTYRNPSVSKGLNNAYHLCGGAGDCSTTASPRRDSAVNNLSSGDGRPSISGSSAVATNDALLAVYTCGSAAATRNRGGGSSDAASNGEG